jgi:hypothetical protein
MPSDTELFTTWRCRSVEQQPRRGNRKEQKRKCGSSECGEREREREKARKREREPHGSFTGAVICAAAQ